MKRKVILAGIMLAVLAAVFWIASFWIVSRSTPIAAEVTPGEATSSAFVTTDGGKFSLSGQPYYFVGANFWQGMWMGMDAPDGDRDGLAAELDTLREMGVTNVRIMASSEGPDTESYRMTPTLMVSPGKYNPAVWDGLDYLLAELSKREMRAVMVLNNYWHWTGGMAQYVSWKEGTAIPYPGDWGAFMEYSAKFYQYPECQIWYRDHIRAMIEHVNSYTGMAYRNDPVIFSWELANEPRRYTADWIDGTAAYIQALDSNHLVTTGSEGSPPGERQDFQSTHAGRDIDYSTIHIWPGNWGWFDPQKPDTYAQAEEQALAYFRQHEAVSVSIGKPLVLEEFGLARDWEPLRDIYLPQSPATLRDRFYTAMFYEVYASATSGGSAAGDNFWAWSGSALPGGRWVGDPPHEIPGWYSIYDTDESTMDVISAHAEAMRRMAAGETAWLLEWLAFRG